MVVLFSTLTTNIKTLILQRPTISLSTGQRGCGAVEPKSLVLLLYVTATAFFCRGGAILVLVVCFTNSTF